MKFTVERIFELMQALTPIINEKRNMPQRGKFALARLHRKLWPEYQLIVEQRNEIIQSLQLPEAEAVPGVPQAVKPRPDEMIVPPSRMKEWEDRWAEIKKMEIEIAGIEPIPLEDMTLDGNGAIEARELWTLDELVIG